MTERAARRPAHGAPPPDDHGARVHSRSHDRRPTTSSATTPGISQCLGPCTAGDRRRRQPRGHDQRPEGAGRANRSHRFPFGTWVDSGLTGCPAHKACEWGVCVGQAGADHGTIRPAFAQLALFPRFEFAPVGNHAYGVRLHSHAGFDRTAKYPFHAGCAPPRVIEPRGTAQCESCQQNGRRCWTTRWPPKSAIDRCTLLRKGQHASGVSPGY